MIKSRKKLIKFLEENLRGDKKLTLENFERALLCSGEPFKNLSNIFEDKDEYRRWLSVHAKHMMKTDSFIWYYALKMENFQNESEYIKQKWDTPEIIPTCYNELDDDIKELKKFEDIIYLLFHKVIPYRYPNSVSIFSTWKISTIMEMKIDGHEYNHQRDLMTSYFSFSLIAMDWINALKDYIIKDGKCLEIMAGSGLLSMALRYAGVDIITTDNNSWSKNKKMNKINPYSSWLSRKFSDILEIDCVDAIEKYGKDVDFIIVSWPYMDDNCYKSLLKMREVNPNARMIYIGENYSGCTANDEFFDEAEGCYDQYPMLNEVNEKFQQWDGIHDFVQVVK